MIRIVLAILAAAGVFVLPALLMAQIPGGSDIAINRTPVVGGINGRCLYVNGTHVGQQVCGAGTAANVAVGTTTVSGGTTTRVLYDNAGTLGEYVISGTGSVCMTTSCVMTTPTIGLATASGITLSNSGALFSTDAALSKFSATNGVYLNGNAAGWLQLSGDGTNRSQQIKLNGGAASNIDILTSGGLRVTVLAGGNVGIGGVTNPGFGLELSGTFGATSLTTAAGTPNSICQNNATKEITVNAALTCTVSSLTFKHGFESLIDQALPTIMAMRPGTFYYNDNNERQRIGFASEYMADIDPRLADGWTADGRSLSIDQNAILAKLVKAFQELKADNDNLLLRLERLEGAIR